MRVPFPEQPHIPGQTPRPPDGFFDHLKTDQDTAVAAGIAYFEAGYFWECHEMFEVVWMGAPLGSAERDMAQAIIQIANGNLKRIMGRDKAVARLRGIAAELLDRIPAQCEPLGQSVEVWRGRM